MIEVNRDKLIEAIKRTYPLMKEEKASAKADAIISATDERLVRNVAEWMAGDELTDIWVGKYCINAIMSIRGDKDFISALDAMNLYIEDEAAGVRKIWRSKR